LGFSVGAHCDASELFELIEEAFDQVPLSIDPSAEREAVFAITLGWDVGPGSTVIGKRSNCIGVVGPISQENRAFAEVVE